MNNPQLLRFASKSGKLLALFFALILSLSLTTTAFAAPLTNGGFGTYRCTHIGWTASTNDSSASSISAGYLSGYIGLSSSDCVAKIEVEASGPAYFTASLSQTFTVPTDTSIPLPHQLSFNIWAQSNNGVLPGQTSGYTGTQRVTILRSNGTPIVTRMRNYDTNQRGVFSYDLSDYVGQTVTLRVSVVLDFVNGTGSPTYGAVYFDDVRFGAAVFGGDAPYYW
jgi:hypothetical protein